MVDVRGKFQRWGKAPFPSFFREIGDPSNPKKFLFVLFRNLFFSVELTSFQIGELTLSLLSVSLFFLLIEVEAKAFVWR